METKAKSGRPSSPRQFFERIYGDLERKKDNSSGTREIVTQAEIVAPVPVLATPLPFFLPGTSEAHLTAAAAGLSAFRKNLVLYFIVCILYRNITNLVSNLPTCSDF